MRPPERFRKLKQFFHLDQPLLPRPPSPSSPPIPNPESRLPTTPCQGRFYSSLVTIFILLSLSLFSQDFFSHRDQILDNHWKKLGPLYLTPALLIRNLGYSDNIYQYSAYAAGDWTADLGLRLQSDILLGRRLILSYQLTPEYHFYAENSELSNWTAGQRLELHSYLGFLDLRVGGQLNQSWGVPNPEYGLSLRYKTRGGDLAISLGNPNYLHLQFHGSLTENEYEDRRYIGVYDLSLFDYRLQSAGLALGTRVFTRTRLSLSYTRQELRYPSLPDLDAAIDQLGLNLVLPELSSLRGSLSLGVQRYRPKNGAFSPLDTPYGSGSVIFQPGKRWRLVLGYRISVQNSFRETDRVLLQAGWNAGLDIYLARRWRVGYRLNDNRLSYRLRSEAGTTLFRDHFQTHGAVLAYRLFQKTAIGLSWSRVHSLETGSGWGRNYSFIGGYLETDF